jgi:hypothetical protein
MAVGTESGNVVIYEAPVAGPSLFQECLLLDHGCVIPPEAAWIETLIPILPCASITHVDQVHRLAWRPSQARYSPDSACDLAMCAEDRSLRILRITFS